MDTHFLLELSNEEFYDVMMDYTWKEPPEDIRKETNKVYGCATNVWVARIDGELFQDSTGQFVKGTMAALLDHLEDLDYDDINQVELSDFPFLTPDRISMRRMRGFDMALKKIKKLHSD